MREGMNKVMLVGNVGSEPECSQTSNGWVKLSFSVATGERRKQKDGSYADHTEWHRITLFGARAEGLAKVLHKGSEVCIEGSLRTRSWEDRDGNKRSVTEVDPFRVILLGSARGAYDAGQRGGSQRRDSHDQQKRNGYQPDPDPNNGSETDGFGTDGDDIPF